MTLNTAMCLQGHEDHQEKKKADEGEEPGQPKYRTTLSDPLVDGAVAVCLLVPYVLLPSNQ